MDRITKSAPDIGGDLNALERVLNKARAMPPDDALKIVSRGNASRQQRGIFRVCSPARRRVPATMVRCVTGHGISRPSHPVSWFVVDPDHKARPAPKLTLHC
jgi:hypothetical protein